MEISHPLEPIYRLKCVNLVQMQEAVLAKGSSVDDWVSLSEKQGDDLGAHFCVCSVGLT